MTDSTLDPWAYPAILAMLAALGTALQRWLAYLDRRDRRRLRVDLERVRAEHPTDHEASSTTEPEPSASPSSASSGRLPPSG